MEKKDSLIPAENIPRVHLVLHTVQTVVIAVGNDGLTLLLECFQIKHRGHSTWLLQHLIRNEILARTVTFHDCLNQADTIIDLLYIFKDHIYCHHLIIQTKV